MDLNQLKKDINVGINGAYIITKTFLPKMIQKKEGNIINIGSDLSVNSPDHKIYEYKGNKYLKPISYSIIKHGMVGFTKYLATLLAEHKIICNMVSPGPIKKDQPIYLETRLKKNIPLKKLANLGDVVPFIIYLSEQKNYYLTGQNFILDGGKHLI